MNFLTPTTELEAVNLMLSAIGESPITSLDDGSSVDTTQALLMLANVSRQVQQRGWWFNTDEEFTLNPDNYSKNIFVPANTLKISSTVNTSVVMRGNKLYDKTNHSYIFDAPVVLSEIVFMLPFEELPEPARNLITQRAGRMFQERMLGSDTLSRFTERDERMASIDLETAEIDARQPNMLTGSTFTQNITRRS